jgi:hypothetical protein
LRDYVASDSDSPQLTLSVISAPRTIYEQTSEEFRFQRIEDIKIFGSLKTAESCHLISRAHCNNYPTTYGRYNNDPNNRLALSRDLHDSYDGRNCIVPLFNIELEHISDNLSNENRYEVKLLIKAFNAEAESLYLYRLKNGSERVTDLTMRVSVFVRNAEVFAKCLEWKRQEVQRKWEEMQNMTSAVP